MNLENYLMNLKKEMAQLEMKIRSGRLVVMPKQAVQPISDGRLFRSLEPGRVRPVSSEASACST